MITHLDEAKARSMAESGMKLEAIAYTIGVDREELAKACPRIKRDPEANYPATVPRGVPHPSPPEGAPGEWRRVKYNRLKALVRQHVRISDEDFLFVKAYDQRNNNLRSIRHARVFRDNVSGGYGSNPRR